MNTWCKQLHLYNLIEARHFCLTATGQKYSLWASTGRCVALNVSALTHICVFCLCVCVVLISGDKTVQPGWWGQKGRRVYQVKSDWTGLWQCVCVHASSVIFWTPLLWKCWVQFKVHWVSKTHTRWLFSVVIIRLYSSECLLLVTCCMWINELPL